MLPVPASVWLLVVKLTPPEPALKTEVTPLTVIPLEKVMAGFCEERSKIPPELTVTVPVKT